MPKRLLISWIGHNDLRPMALEQPEKIRNQILDELGGAPRSSDLGPIRTLTEAEDFDRVVLLSNAKADWVKRYKSWLGNSPETARVKIESPTDYESIFRAVDEELSKLRLAGALDDCELCVHLSPGTPAMRPFRCRPRIGLAHRWVDARVTAETGAAPLLPSLSRAQVTRTATRRKSGFTPPQC